MYRDYLVTMFLVDPALKRHLGLNTDQNTFNREYWSIYLIQKSSKNENVRKMSQQAQQLLYYNPLTSRRTDGGKNRIVGSRCVLGKQFLSMGAT